jgi:hypothetical protein
MYDPYLVHRVLDKPYIYKPAIVRPTTPIDGQKLGSSRRAGLSSIHQGSQN